MADTVWVQPVDDKIIRQSGAFDSQVKDSRSVGGIDNFPNGISYDENGNVPWEGIEADKLYVQSAFSATLKDSESIGGIDLSPTDIGYDDDGDTPWVGTNDDKLYLQSSQLTSTLKSSVGVGGVDTDPGGISWTDANTIVWCGHQADKLYEQSAYTSTIKTSQAVSETLLAGSGWTGADTLYTGTTDDKLVRASGKFSATVKDSHSVAGKDPFGIETTDWSTRIGGPLTATATALNAAPTYGTHGTTPVYPSALNASPTLGTHAASLAATATALDASPTLGTHGALVRFDQTFEQAYRVANTAVDLFELYVGEDAAVDFSASGQPVATSATLPFTWTPTPPASGSTKVLHIVVRRRNAYDLQSHNVYERLVEIDSAGVQLSGPVTAPVDVALYDPLTSGAVRVVAVYNNDDDENPADTWEVYIGVGADPTPGVDTPLYTGTMTFIGSQAFLAQTISDSAFGAGDTVHVIVTAKRASDSERGNASAVQITLAASLDLTSGQLYGGTYYEQR